MTGSGKKSGGTLVMVMLVLIGLSIISIGLFKLAEYDSVETAREIQSAQAFWLAESGLQQTLEKILTDEDYRSAAPSDEAYAYDPDGNSPYTVTIDDSGRTGEYDVDVWRDGSDYSIIVQAQVGIMKRRLTILAEDVRPDLSYAIMALNGNARIKKDGTIQGSLYTWGELTLFSGVSVLGDIFAKDFNGSSDYNVTEIDDPITLEFDEDFYNNEIQAAANGNPGSGDTLNNDYAEADLDLNAYADNTLYVNGDVDIAEKITGPGKLVINGNIEFKKNYSIDDDIQIILNGNFIAKKEGTLGSSINVFAKGNGDFDKATMSGSGASSMVFVGNFNADKEIVYSGLIYAGGNVNFKKTSIIEGTIVAGEDFDIDKNSMITYNADMIPDWILEDLIVVERFTSDNTWDELPPL